MKWKVTCIVVLMALTALVIHGRGATDERVEGVPLAALPMQIGTFQGTEQVITSDVLQVLGDGRFLSRSYADTGQPGEPPLDLLVAFYPTQRSGQSIHSPQNCLPGAGWSFEESGTVQFSDREGKQHRVAEYRVSNGGTQMEVLYWYRSRGRDLASDYAAKAFLMIQAVRDGRTDGGLVRVMTPIRLHETQPQARARALAFVRELDPLLPQFLPN